MVTGRVFHVWVSTDTCNFDVITGNFTKALPVITDSCYVLWRAYSVADTIMCHGESTAGGQSLVSIICCVGTNFVAIWFMHSARGMQRDNLWQVTHTHWLPLVLHRSNTVGPCIYIRAHNL